MIEKLEGDHFLSYWPLIEARLKCIPHVWEPWWTLESIREYTLDGRFQCWGIGNAGTITGIAFSQIAMYPAGGVLQVVLAFGEGMIETVDLIDATLSRFGALNGCSSAEVTGRPGWEPNLRKLGFRRANTVLRKKLELERLN